jgi:hypothetical protein
MNFCFHTPDGRGCTGRLWATGRYGFSLPKTVEIVTPDGLVHTYVFPNRQVRDNAGPANRALVRLAITQFLRGEGGPGTSVDIDLDAEPYPGDVKPVRPLAPRTPLRVRPGRPHARRGPAVDPG